MVEGHHADVGAFRQAFGQWIPARDGADWHNVANAMGLDAEKADKLASIVKSIEDYVSSLDPDDVRVHSG